MIEVQEPSDITLGALPMRETAKLWHIDFGEITPEAEALYDERLLGAYVYDGCTYEENLKRWRIPRKVFRRGDWGTESIVIGLDQTSFFSLRSWMPTAVLLSAIPASRRWRLCSKVPAN